MVVKRTVKADGTVSEMRFELTEDEDQRSCSGFPKNSVEFKRIDDLRLFESRKGAAAR